MTIRSLGTVAGVDPQVVIADVASAQCERLVGLFSSFEGADWLRPSRCSGWNVHEVVRHLADVAELHCAACHGEPLPFSLEAGFDPNSTPGLWVAESAGESPAETISRYRAGSLRTAELARVRAGEESDAIGLAPYGPVHWTTATAHMLWDAWVHERDVVAGTGSEPDVGAPESDLVFAYGLAVTLAIVRPDEPFEAVLDTAEPGRAVTIASGPDQVGISFGGAVSSGAVGIGLAESATRAQLIDSLAGRGDSIGDILEGDVATIAALSVLATYFTSARL